MMSDTLATTAYVARPRRSLVEYRAQLAACLEDMGDDGVAFVRAKELREWIAILDDAIGRQK